MIQIDVDQLRAQMQTNQVFNEFVDKMTLRIIDEPTEALARPKVLELCKTMYLAGIRYTVTLTGIESSALTNSLENQP